MFREFEFTTGHAMMIGTLIEPASDELQHANCEIEIHKDGAPRDEFVANFMMHYRFYSVCTHDMNENDLFMLYTYYQFVRRVKNECDAPYAEINKAIKRFAADFELEMATQDRIKYDY